MSTGSLIVAAESTYGTAPASGWRQLEVTSDGHTTKQEPLVYRGIRNDTAAPSLSGFRLIDKGGEGTIEVGGFSNGLGILFATWAGSAVSAVKAGGTLAYQQEFAMTPDGPPANKSISTEVRRERRNGTVDAFTYKGGRVTQLDIDQSIDGHLMFKFVMDYLTVARPNSAPSRSETIVDPALVYSWADAAITLGAADGTPADATECVESFSASLPTGVDTEEWCIKKGTTRHIPMLKGTPEPTGSISWKYQDPRYYDAFVAGEVFSISAFWEGYTAIESTTKPSLLIDIPAIRFTGEDPEISVDDSTMQNLPFSVYDNGTDDPVKITFITSDTAF